MQSLSKYNKRIKCLLCAVDLFDKYAQFFPLKDKKIISIVKSFQKILDSSDRKPNKILKKVIVKFDNYLFQRLLRINNTEMCSTYNEGKSVVGERFIRTLKNNIFKHIKAVSKSVCFDVLDDIVNKYNSTVNKTIKKKPIGVTSDSHSEHNKESNEKDPKFKVGDHVRISKYKIIFTKGQSKIRLEEVFVVSKIKNTVLWTYVISYLNGEQISGSFFEEELQKTTQNEFRI